ncbi:hypothetical protein M8J77_018756 [Diaphorina citri]|nr:hypothetical protein M8J77_018756 [Diaphorina citri]
MKISIVFMLICIAITTTSASPLFNNWQESADLNSWSEPSASFDNGNEISSSFFNKWNDVSLGGFVPSFLVKAGQNKFQRQIKMKIKRKYKNWLKKLATGTLKYSKDTLKRLSPVVTAEIGGEEDEFGKPAPELRKFQVFEV